MVSGNQYHETKPTLKWLWSTHDYNRGLFYGFYNYSFIKKHYATVDSGKDQYCPQTFEITRYLAFISLQNSNY